MPETSADPTPEKGPAPPSKRQLVESQYPDLTYHYGIMPADIAQLPRAVKEIYLAAIPRLVANDQLRAIEAAAYPHLDESTQRTISRRWRDLLGATEDSESVKPKDIDETRMLAMASGIGVVIEPRPDAGPEEAAGE